MHDTVINLASNFSNFKNQKVYSAKMKAEGFVCENLKLINGFIFGRQIGGKIEETARGELQGSALDPLQLNLPINDLLYNTCIFEYIFCMRRNCRISGRSSKIRGCEIIQPMAWK